VEVGFDLGFGVGFGVGFDVGFDVGLVNVLVAEGLSIVVATFVLLSPYFVLLLPVPPVVDVLDFMRLKRSARDVVADATATVLP
tara:strand:- start:5 stop:256 length:252 start_codon:yes stop_codon:yes gene_type:complete